MRPNFGHHPICDTLRAVVVLGSPRRECAGSGICMITTAHALNSRWRCPHLLAEISKIAPNVLSFRFLKQYASVPAIENYFSTGHFTISDAYYLPLYLLRRIDLPWSVYIAPGLYPVVETDDTWELLFPIIAVQKEVEAYSTF